jgi:type II pantothenate kinase
VDNAGADAVLGMLPLARELLRNGSEVVMVANSQPAINDLTTSELRSLVRKAATICPIIAAAREAANRATAANDSIIPPPPGVPSRRESHDEAGASPIL